MSCTRWSHNPHRDKRLQELSMDITLGKFSPYETEYPRNAVRHNPLSVRETWFRSPSRLLRSLVLVLMNAVRTMRTPSSICMCSAPDASGSRPMPEVVCLHTNRINNCNLYLRVTYKNIRIFKDIKLYLFYKKEPNYEQWSASITRSVTFGHSA